MFNVRSPLRHRGGFTLIELLLVIGIIAILAAIVIVAINPTKQLADARNAQRRSDVNTILNAVYQYSIDHTGNLPDTLTSIPAGQEVQICKKKDLPDDPLTPGRDCNEGDTPFTSVHLSMLTGTYLVSIPIDPRVPNSATGTRYLIQRTTGNRVTVRSPDAENAQTITVTR